MLYTQLSILRHNLKYETHTKFKLKLDFDIFDNKHTDKMLSNHNEMSILYKRLYYNKHGGLTICMHINFIILGLDLLSVIFLRFSNIGFREKNYFT